MCIDNYLMGGLVKCPIKLAGHVEIMDENCLPRRMCIRRRVGGEGLTCCVLPTSRDTPRKHCGRHGLGALAEIEDSAVRSCRLCIEYTL